MVNPANEQLAAWGRIGEYLNAGRLNLILRVDGTVIPHNPMGTPTTKNDNITFDLGALQPYFLSRKDRIQPNQYTISHVFVGFSNNMDFLFKLWNTEIPDAAKLIIRKYDGSKGIYTELTIEDFLSNLYAIDLITLSIDEVDSKGQRFINVKAAYNSETPPLRMAISSGDFLYFRCPWDPFRAEGYRNLEIVEGVFKSVYGMDFKEYHNQVNVPYREKARNQLTDLLLSKAG